MLGSFESFISSLGEPSADLNDVLSTLSSTDVADYLPAERPDAPTTTVRSRSRRATGSTGEEDDDDEPGHEDEDDEQDEEDENDEEDETDEEDDEDPFIYLRTADISRRLRIGHCCDTRCIHSGGRHRWPFHHALL